MCKALSFHSSILGKLIEGRTEGGSDEILTLRTLPATTGRLATTTDW